MEKDSGHKLNNLAVDGGMSNSDICMQVSITFSLRCISRIDIPGKNFNKKFKKKNTDNPS